MKRMIVSSQRIVLTEYADDKLADRFIKYCKAAGHPSAEIVNSSPDIEMKSVINVPLSRLQTLAEQFMKSNDHSIILEFCPEPNNNTIKRLSYRYK